MIDPTLDPATQPPKRALLLHGKSPRLEYSETLLGRPAIQLDRRQRLEEAFTAVCGMSHQLVIVEPQLLDGDALKLAERLNANPELRRPPILRVGDAAEVAKPWPFPALTFTTSGGLDTFDQMLTALLRLPKRQAHRYTTRLNFAQKGQRAVLGQSVNISASGMLFASTRSLEKGAQVELEIMGIPALQETPICGRVIRQESAKSILPLYAIEFRDLTAELRLRLQKFLDSSGQLAMPAF